MCTWGSSASSRAKARLTHLQRGRLELRFRAIGLRCSTQTRRQHSHDAGSGGPEPLDTPDTGGEHTR